MLAPDKHALLDSRRSLDPSQGIDEVADLLIENGRIAALWRGDRANQHYTSWPTIEADGLVVTPGFVDLHCHLRYPGLAGEETIASGTSAAIRGGFTTVCAMANTKPPMDTPAKLEYVSAVIGAEARCTVKVIGAVSQNLAGNVNTSGADLLNAGAIALSDDGNPVWNSDVMTNALAQSERLGVPISAHEEIKDGTDADHQIHVGHARVKQA